MAPHSRTLTAADGWQLTASTSIDSAHIKVNGCGGQVTIRSYTTLETTTDTSQNSVTVYGDPIRI